MSLAIEVSLTLPDDVDAVAFGVLDGPDSIGPRALDAVGAGKRGFTGSLAGTFATSDGDDRLLVAVGLGKRDRIDGEVLRRVGAAAARAAKKCSSLAIEIDPIVSLGFDAAAVASAVTEGAALAGYRFDRFRSEPEEVVLQRLAIVSEHAGATPGAARAEAVTEAVVLCRDLINTPAGDLPPRVFAEIASDVAERTGLSVEIYDEDRIRAERLGGLLGVAAGSHEPPRFIRLAYEPSGATASTASVALVGKGITFDSGGLSIKPAASMMSMKYDMSGAAAVLAAMSACGRVGVPVRVFGYLPVTENMPGGSATRPGDVLKIRNGKTIEVLNTDAEGRLVLADALSLAAEDAPDAIVDLATLTGACVVALGKQIAGLMGNDDAFIEAVGRAGARAGEAFWPLPVPSGYRSQIDSDVADMKNIGANGQAGALAAALLLQEFVGSVPWVHLDIAGPAFSDDDKGYQKKGGTGFGVRTLLELLESYQPIGREATGEAKGITVLR